MTQDQERKLLQSLHDRLFDAITYAPGGDRLAVFDRAATLVQLSRNEALNAADFRNAMSPINPNGDQRAALAFSRMVDQIPAVSGDFTPSGRTISKTYQQIVNSANTSNAVSRQHKATYDKAVSSLSATTSLPNFDGPPSVTTSPSSILQSYQDNETAYVSALIGYRSAQNGCDLDDPRDQRAFQAVAPGLQLNIDRAWNTWSRQGKQNVDRTRNALVSSLDDVSASAIAAAKSDMSDQHWLSGLSSADARWMPAYALPSDWAMGSSGATDFSLDSSHLYTLPDSSFSSSGAGASWSAGLWSVGGSSPGSSGSTNHHLNAHNVSISARLQLVRIMRPWLNQLLFTMKGWWLEGQSANAISNGRLKGNESSMLPLIPTAMVVVSDVTITADFSSQDRSHIESALSGTVRVGLGPFQVSGSCSHSSSSETVAAQFDGSSLRIPGLQILAWINAITPASAPMTAPAAASAIA